MSLSVTGSNKMTHLKSKKYKNMLHEIINNNLHLLMFSPGYLLDQDLT